ncbi:MAG: glycosyltransferase [Oscillospiraceae bacterium]|nr:glycosyltransferase [Oscillospiraceae bacterium]
MGDELKILHYSLGFPPYRTGGMTKFCIDLIKRQIDRGDSAGLMWPGRITIGKTKIKTGVGVDGIESYEVINPLPVPYDEGISNPEKFMSNGDYDCYQEFIRENRPDVLHIHTFMGLHKNLLIAAKDNGVKIIFTAHDFFAICPKVTLLRNNAVCTMGCSCDACPACNSSALSLIKMAILQSVVYRKLKDNYFVRHIRKYHRKKHLSNNDAGENSISGNYAIAEDYKKLRRHYESMMRMADTVHYNSTLTRDVYESFINYKGGVVIPITHGDISDNKKIRKYSNEKLKITYMGPESVGKGFFVIKEALDALRKYRQDFVLNIFFAPEKVEPYMNVMPPYNYADMEAIFENTDIMVAPAVAYETFGFTVLEAASYGIPVIITKNIGAKDILPEEGMIILEDASSCVLQKAIEDLDACRLSQMNKALTEKMHVDNMEALCIKIKENFY